MQCPHCGQEHPDTTSFCPTTGLRLAGSSYCINCGFKLQENWKVCPKCGKSVGFAGANTSPKFSHPSSKILPLAFVLFLVVVVAVATYSVFSGQIKSIVEKSTGDNLSTEATQVHNSSKDGDSPALTNNSVGIPARLLYKTEEQGVQKLWIRDLSEPEPILLASGAQLRYFGGLEGFTFMISQQQNGVFDVYVVDDTNNIDPRLIASDVKRAYADKTPDGSKFFVLKATLSGESLELTDVKSGQTKIIVQEVESVFPLFINKGQSLAFEVTQNGLQSLYVVDVNLQQEPRKLAEGKYIYLLSYYDTDHLAWLIYEQGQKSVYIFDPVNGISQELLRAPNIRWSILKDGGVSFTLDKTDGTEQYFHLRGDELRETNGQIIKFSPDGKYIIYQKYWQKYIGTIDGVDLGELPIVEEEQIDQIQFTPDSRHVIYSTRSVNQKQYQFRSKSIGFDNLGGISWSISPGDGTVDPNQEVFPFTYPSGFAYVSNNVFLGGIVIPTKDPTSIIVYESYILGEEAKSYLISRGSINGDYGDGIGGSGEGVLVEQPRLTPDEKACFSIERRSNGSQILKSFLADGSDKTLFTSESIFPDATNIMYQFTSDGKYSVIGVTTRMNEYKIFLLNLATYELEFLTYGSEPWLLDQYSLDGIQPWK